jgi:thiol:disulfide interchange protein
VVSFLALGAVMLALRAAGEQLGWGFQLQSPAVVAGMAILFTVIGLNLAGLFEFGSFLPSSVASLEARNPAVNSFLTGVLAVAIASPCTAPFMGASLGFAIGLPAAQALLVFGAIGLGMALPYLLASWVPAVANALPRPGAWMDTFRRLMAFPMFATVAWLVWVLGQQSGIDGAGALLGLLVGISLVIWSLTLQGRTRAVIAIAAIALCIAFVGSTGQSITKIQPLSDRCGHCVRLANLGTWQGRADRGHRPAGVCGFHRCLVRDLPVQQEDHLGQRRRHGRFGRKKCGPAARRLDAARPRHHRRVAATGSQWCARVCVLQTRRSASAVV